MSIGDDIKTVKDQQEWVAKHRPYLEDGQSHVDLEGGSCLSEVPAMLTKEQWEEADKVVARSFELFAPLTSVLLRQGPDRNMVLELNGMSKTVLESAPPSQEALPLPITHSDCFITPRGLELDKSFAMAQASAARVGEAVEKQLLGDLLKHAKESSDPVKALQDAKFCGPYRAVYQDHEQTDAVLKRWLNRDGCEDCVLSPQLPPSWVLLVQFTPDVVRLVVGMRPVLLQWEDHFKVACIVVPQVRRSIDGSFGAVVAV